MNKLVYSFRKVYLCSKISLGKMYRSHIKKLINRKLDKNKMPLVFLGAKDNFICVKKMVELPVGEQFVSRGFLDVGKTSNLEFDL